MNLTDRQKQVLREWVKTYSMKAVACDLGRSPKTIAHSLERTREILGLKTLYDLCKWATWHLSPLFMVCTLCAQPSLPPVPKANPAPSVTLAWDASPSTNIAGYNLYQGPASRTYTNVLNVGKVLSFTVTNYQRGWTIYFAATAYGTNGLESDFSNELVFSSPLPPQPPGSLRITAQIAKAASGPWDTFTNMPSVVVTNDLSSNFFRLQIAGEP